MARRFDRPPPEPRRVVVTGAGILTAHGNGWRANADAFREGARSLKPVTVFDTARHRTKTAGRAELPETLPPNRLSARDAARMERGSRMLLHAGHEALTRAGWTAEDLAETPVVLGTSAGAMALGEDFYRGARGLRRRGQATRATHYQPQSQAALLCRAFGIGGPVTLISNACASGANAVGHAFQLVRRGATERVLCGGYDALCELVFAGFDSLKALSPTTPRPFDAGRDGLALGEGAALLTVESLESARARGAEILAEILADGAATDLHHLTQPHPEGDAALASMSRACAAAGLPAEAVEYINSHGTGTPLNDVAEGRAIQRWAGDAVNRVAVSSTKGGIGHLLGGAGAVEAVVCLMALREGFLPPNAPVETPDAVCTFDLVQTPRAHPLRVALTNSFGFGGSNATLIFRAGGDN